MRKRRKIRKPQTPGATTISVRNVAKSFGSVKAVNGLSFDVHEGEVVGLLGPNGAGKTTAMRMITGYFAPDSGDVEISGHSVLDSRIEAQRHVGYLPENNPVYADMLVSEFLQLSARLKQMDKKDIADGTDMVVNAVGLQQVYYRSIRNLSKGFRQRVGMAAAMINQPKILILDEPTEGLDPNQRTEIRALIKELAKERTIMLSTHVLQEAQAICDRLIIVKHGKVVADGSTEELSRAAGRDHILYIDAEGPGVVKALKGIHGVAKVEVDNTDGDRVRARMIVEGERPVQPLLARIVADREWIIWKLAEDEQKLEDIFTELTREQ